MTNQDFIDNIKASYAQGVAIIEKKNADYATVADPFKNFRSADVAGVGVERAILVRILDKLSRVSNCLDKDPAVIEETVADTLLDMMNYAAILKAHRELVTIPSLTKPSVA
jgi:hypothetical protein